MRYLVTARVKPGREKALANAIEHRTLGVGSIAGAEYLHNMETARLLRDGSVRWIEVCYCDTPLQEERPYWEVYFDLVKVQHMHAAVARTSTARKPGRADTATARTNSNPDSPPGALCSAIPSDAAVHHGGHRVRTEAFFPTTRIPLHFLGALCGKGQRQRIVAMDLAASSRRRVGRMPR